MKADKYFVSINSSVETHTQKIKIQEKSTQGSFTRIEDNLYSVKLDSASFMPFRDKFSLNISGETLEAEVLFPILEKYNKRRMKRAIALLQAPSDNLPALIEAIFEIEPSPVFKNYINFLSLSTDKLLPVLESMQLQGTLKIIEYTSLTVISTPFFKSLSDQIRAKLKDAIANSKRSTPLDEIFRNISYTPTGLLRAYLLQQLQTDIPHSLIDDKVQFLNPSINSKDKKIVTAITDTLETVPKPIMSFDQLASKTGIPFNQLSNALWYLINEGTVTQLNPQEIIYTEFLTKLINKLKKYKRNYGDNIDINAFRTQTSLNREQIIAVFEYCDSQGITSRIGNIRRILLTV